MADGKKIIAYDSAKLSMVEVTVDAKRHNQFEAVGGTYGMQSMLDAAEGMGFVINQLAYTEATVFARQYTPMQYERLVPISFEAGEWASEIRYMISDAVGQAKRISGNDNALPSVDVSLADRSMKVYHGGVRYGYSQQELRESAKLQRSLPTMKLDAAIEAYRRHLNTVA